MTEQAGIAQAALKAKPSQIYAWGGVALTAIGLIGFLGMSAYGVDGQNVEPFHGLIVAMIGLSMLYFSYTAGRNAQISDQNHELRMADKRND